MSPKMQLKRIMALVLATAVLTQSVPAFAAEDDTKEQQDPIHGIYVIARCVAFRDPFMDEVKPDWMLKTKDGAIYEDNKGFKWMDPWNQGFTASYLKKYRNYGAQEIRDQIKAVNDNGVDSWIIWNPSCKYAWDAFK